MVVVGFYSYVFPHLGDGPLWTERLTQEVDRCRSNWWTNLLFINNYVNSDNQCMVQSWYLACDMQFFMVGFVLVYVLWRWPRLGQTLLWTTLVASIATPAIIPYHNRYYGTLLHYMRSMFPW
ncbi:hypothetical protein J6590_080609 [Homalodisca vitripennis]|nr:hypothetical protein J6590_080609 [Homalodisca vitripennis]